MPVQKGTTEDYWNGAAGVVRIHSGQKTWFLAEPINGTFLYCTHDLGGSRVYYYISADEVFADFPRTIDQLGGPGKTVLGWAAPAFRDWEQADPLRSHPYLLILLLKEAKQEWWTQTGLIGYRLAYTNEDFNLGLAYQRMRLFPLLKLGEWGYLSALWVFLVWPWVRNLSLSRRAIHAAVLPLLLLLPYYLGYCAWNFTSARSTGGVVYPYLLDALMPLPWTPIDQALIQYVPQVFTALTEPIRHISLFPEGDRSAGPLAALGLGLVLGAAVFVLGLLLRKMDRSGMFYPSRVPYQEQ
jgi:hypothetical protein